jgi:hypothetical protein
VPLYLLPVSYFQWNNCSQLQDSGEIPLSEVSFKFSAESALPIIKFGLEDLGAQGKINEFMSRPSCFLARHVPLYLLPVSYFQWNNCSQLQDSGGIPLGEVSFEFSAESALPIMKFGLEDLGAQGKINEFMSRFDYEVNYSDVFSGNLFFWFRSISGYCCSRE